MSTTDAEGVIRLRWRHQGQRYSLNLSLAYAAHNLPRAAIIAAQIKLDMIQGIFDTSLEKYGKIRERFEETTVKEINPKQPYKPVFPVLLGDLIPEFDNWAINIRNVDINKSAKYSDLQRVLRQWKAHSIESLPLLMACEKWSPNTYNGRLGYFRIFLNYLAKKKKIHDNPLDDINRRKQSRKSNSKREPMTSEEIMTLLDAFKTDKFTSKYSKHKHSHYYPFLYFMFATGVRNAEAICLRVKHIDIHNSVAEISEVLARTIEGSNHAARVIKGTKTENMRFLPLTDQLKELLECQIEGKRPHELVFPPPRVLSINHQMFEKRVLKPVLRALELGNRDLYVARHSFGTRAVQQGMVITDVAYLMGLSTIETAIRNYVGIARPANKLPEIQ